MSWLHYCILHLKLITNWRIAWILHVLYQSTEFTASHGSWVRPYVCQLYYYKKLVPSMSWEVIEFFSMSVFQPDCVVILSRQTLSGTTLNLLDLSYLVTTCFSVQSPCAILNLPVFTALAFCLWLHLCVQ